jgi:non-ribosomal peptide synthetase component F
VNPIADSLAGLSPEQRELLLRRLARARAASPASSPDVPAPRPRDGRPPRASIGQEGIWEIDRLDPGNPALNIMYPVRLRGPLDAAALSRAVDEVVRRHDSLRTTFAVADGGLVQVVHPAGTARLEVEDLSALPLAGREKALRARSNAELSRRFSLEDGPLFAATLLVLDRDEHALLLVMHHVVSDGFSLDVLFRDLAACYDAFARGEPSPLAPPSLQYPDWGEWQRARLEGPRGAALAEWWREALRGMPMVLPLPTDRPRPLKRFQHGAGYPFRISAQSADRLRALGRGEGATLFMTLLTLFQAVLHRWTGSLDFGVGTPVANRTRMEEEELIGYLINLLVLRARLDGDPSFRALLARVRGTVSSAFAHQELPFETLLDVLQPGPMRCHPFFQVMFILQNASGDLHLPGVRAELLPADRTAVEYDINLDVAEMPDGSLACGFEYSTELFDADTIARLALHYRRLADAVADDPDLPVSALPLLTPEEERRLRVEWNGPVVQRPESLCVHHLFEEHARAAPDAPAVRFDGRTITRGELDRRASSLAGVLRARGTGPERCVGVWMDRSPQSVVAMLAVWKAGGAVVPLNPADAPARLAQTLADASAWVVLGGATTVVVEGAEHIEVDLDDPPPGGAESEHGGITAHPASAACWLRDDVADRTIVLDHTALADTALALRHALDVRPGDRVLGAFPGVTGAITEALVSVFAGAELVLPSPNIQDLARTLEEEGVTHSLVTAADAAGLAGAELPGLRVVVVTDASATVDAVQPGRILLRLFGPVEMLGCATVAQVHPETPTSIGRPRVNMRAWVLERGLRLLPVGVAGELCVGERVLARGYAGRPAETAERFVPDPFAERTGARLFRTGMLARWRPEGVLELLPGLGSLRGVPPLTVLSAQRSALQG